MTSDDRFVVDDLFECIGGHCHLNDVAFLLLKLDSSTANTKNTLCSFSWGTLVHAYYYNSCRNGEFASQISQVATEKMSLPTLSSRTMEDVNFRV